MPQATRDGVAIHYERDRPDGGTDAEPVVFLQGLGYGRWMWRWQREALRETGAYDVLAPDTRGTGQSDAGLPPVLPRFPRRLRRPLLLQFGYSIEGLAADLEAVLADAGVDRAHLVGASLGGMIALQYAVEYDRTASLALVATSHGGPDAVPVPEETRAHVFDVPRGATRRETFRHRMRPALTERFTNRNPHLLDRIVEWRLEQDAPDPARTAQAAAALGVDVSGHLDRIRVPTLVIHGTDDRVRPVENGRLLAEKVPDSRYVELEGGSHLCVVESADRVAAELVAFLRTASTASSPAV